MPHFTVDWFSHNIPTWKQIFGNLDLLNSTRPLKALEVGSWEGQSACWLLQHVCCNTNSRLTCIDTWAGAEQYDQYVGASSWGIDKQQHEGGKVFERFKDNIAELGAANRVVMMQQLSWSALATLLCSHAETFDVVYIDGSHEASDVLTDAVMAWKLLAHGGIMILDDYMWHKVTQLDKQHTPHTAIDVFLDIFSEELYVLVLEYQCIVQKHKKDSQSKTQAA